MRLLLVTVAVLLALGATIAVVWQKRRAEDQRIRAAIEKARADRKAGRATAAARLLAPIEAERSGRSDVLLELGLAEADRGRLAAAMYAWEQIPASSPDFPSAATCQAQVEILRGRFEVAETLLLQALGATNVGLIDARDALVRLLRSEGRFAEARRHYLDGMDEAPELVSFLRRLHRLDVEPFASEGIRLYLDKAARQAPEDDRVWLGRAHLETRLGRLDEASRWIEACLKRRPDDPAVWSARLEWAKAAGRPDVALACLPHVPADRARALELRAWFAAHRRDLDDERKALEELIQLDPSLPTALTRLAELSVLAGHPEDAVRYRTRKDERDRNLYKYENILASSEAASKAGDLARISAALGWKFEADCWKAVASGQPSSHPRPPKPEPGVLADLLPILSAVAATKATPAAPPTSASVTFVDDAEAKGLKFVHSNGDPGGLMIPPVTFSGGVGLLDYDGDGWLDVYCVQGGTYPPRPDPAGVGDRLYRNRGDGSFEDVTDAAKLGGDRGYGHGVSVGDYDNDGRPDLFVTRWRTYSLYRNRGDGTFEDVTESVGFGGDRDWPTSSAFADLDNDGDLDLYVCHYLRWDENDTRACIDPKSPAVYHCNPRDFPALPDHVFRNDGGKFVDVTSEAGFVDPDGRGLGVLAADLDDDGRVELFVANDTSANYLFRNLGGFRFEEVGLASGVAANAGGGFQAGMGVASGDLNGDGLPDLAVTNFYNESTTFFRNLGGGFFSDATAAVGLAAPSRFLLGFGVSFLDANADGFLDLMTVNGHVHDGRPQFPYTMPAQLLLGNAQGRLTDVTQAAGDPFKVLRLGRGLAVGDLDNDGRVDALVLSQNEPVAYFHNRPQPGQTSGHHVTLRLLGRESNKDAVGARVTLTSAGRPRLIQRIGGGSYQSASDPRLHFGLGDSTKVDKVEVKWPSGRVDLYENLAADTGHLLQEGDPTPHPLPGWKAPATP
ncbi:FG-GAP-like repeat-containing protein [Singulisphaera sp. PoT]|uniref:FG-GAP-like repeat-containing protein n=1 Tax=Singulisphaera sp. PoT TaxID=3411797 RepID=UPI003BF4B27A